MAKKVQKKSRFNAINDITSHVKCANCGKNIKSGYETSNFLRFQTKYFCGIKCANSKGFSESTNIFYRIHKIVMGIK
ncbi:MAG: hypothetical protein RL632_1653 [Bacteroidota bacterium]|jgi:hypothetical protein